jgi:predicted nucleic acid-binding protein
MTSGHDVRLVVPDASVAAKWYLRDEEHTAQADAIADEFRRGSVNLVVPDCFYYELTGLLRRAERRQPARLSAAQVDAAIADVVALPIPSVESRPYLSQAVWHSRALDVAVYDALHLTVTEHTGATFVTADKSLYDRVRSLASVRWLGNVGDGAATRRVGDATGEPAAGSSP